ncbi:hypothetical protein SDRG_17030 [Saprolegnia diclina VS20]|uniref:Uncharacterized protein n=1 Tax=Saprolegnia diclina (strain VS20) TaxID=1156394 RepID=T0PVP4_SAPDV|nr:hypothetical protein SDRG_17030 [Saprolegnia diclina VS20]EQC25085.1 hypothetical protein SDRG_17030 [Saprolegnia diclina VS20]|eukprot:XP_008621485.1 hypothetical protein SDRG_17030 [Saprolegnia diclina VS20]
MAVSLTKCSTTMTFCTKALGVDFDFQQQLESLYSTYKDSEAPAAELLHAMIKFTREAVSAHTDATTAVANWCYLAEPLLSMYIEQVQVNNTAAANKCLKTVLEKGETVLTEATAKLQQSQLALNKISGVTTTLDPQVRHDFDVARANYASEYNYAVQISAFESFWRGLVNIIVSGVAETKTTIEKKRALSNQVLDAQMAIAEKQVICAKDAVSSAEILLTKARTKHTKDLATVGFIQSKRGTARTFIDLPCSYTTIKNATELKNKCCEYLAAYEKYLSLQ